MRLERECGLPAPHMVMENAIPSSPTFSGREQRDGREESIIRAAHPCPPARRIVQQEGSWTNGPALAIRGIGEVVEAGVAIGDAIPLPAADQRDALTQPQRVHGDA